MSLNKVMLIGHCGQDTPVLRSTAGSNAVAHFSIATNQFWTDREGKRQEKTEWHQIVVFGKLAETCARYLTKGRQIYVEGRLSTREFEGQEKIRRTVTEIVASRIQFLGPREKGEPAETDEGNGDA